MMKDTPIWEEVQRTNPKLETEDEIADEALSLYSGRRGEQRLKEKIAEAAKAEGRSMLDKATIIGALNRFRNALQDFWKGVAELLHIKFKNVNEVADRVLADFMNGVNPNKLGKGKIDGKMREQFVGEKGMHRAARYRTEAEGRLSNLSVAREMEEAKKPAYDIKVATGWERGADGKWRYETPDIRMLPFDMASCMRNGLPTTLGDLIGTNSELFDYYPQLAYVSVKFSIDDKSEPRLGSYSRADNQITISTRGLHEELNAIRQTIKEDRERLKDATTEGVRNTLEGWLKEDNRRYNETAAEIADTLRPTLIHEVQHTIQHIEGFAVGGNELTAERIAAEQGKNLSGYDAYNHLAGEVEARNAAKRVNMSPEQRRRTLAATTEDVSRKDQIFLFGEGGVSASMGDPADTFKERQKRAVEKKGVVMPGLNEAEVDVVDVPKHSFTGTGKQAIDKAKTWAKQNIVGVHSTFNNDGVPYDYTIDDGAVSKFLSSSSTLNSDNLGVHLAVLTKLPEVIDKSIEVEEHPDYKKASGQRSAANGVNSQDMLVHRMYGAAEIDGNIYRVKTTMQEKFGNENVPHDYNVTKIELLISGSSTSDALSNSTGAYGAHSSVAAAKLLHNVKKSYDKGKKLLDESEIADHKKYSLREEGKAETEASDGIRYSLRKKPAPKKTEKCYKLMRLGEDGKLYPLFIDSAAPTELGKWYDADSPNLGNLRKLPSGVHLIDNATGEATSYKDFFAAHKDLFGKGKMTKFPSKEAIAWATDNGARFVYLEDTPKAQRRFEGESRRYWNLGINGSGSVSTFSMRPGWHAGTLPTMRQIGKGAEKNLRDDRFVWVEGEVSADIDYNEEASRNPDHDMPDRIPTDGFYMKATNANKKAAQADRVGWYVAGAFKANRIISDSEARSVIDEWNAAHPEKEVEYDYDRESGKMFNAETMSLEDEADAKYSLRSHGVEEARRNSLASETEDVAREDQIILGKTYGVVEGDGKKYSLREVNEQFNEQLADFTMENADSIIFSLGNPSEALLAAGVEDKPIRLHGSKVAKKMKKHGFSAKELKDLPKAVAHPIAIFDNLGRKGNRAVLTELRTANGNFLVTIDLGKGTEADFDVVSSVFGKNGEGIVNWINKGMLRYVDKEKALNHLHLSAPIAEALGNSRLSSAAKIVQDFENPNIESKKISLRDNDATSLTPAERALREEGKAETMSLEDAGDAKYSLRSHGSEEARKRRETNDIIAKAISIYTNRPLEEVKREQKEKEQRRRDEAKEIYDAVLSGNFDDVTLQRINDYIDNATPKNPYGRRISQRVPQEMERSLHEGERANAVDALFSRICESAVAPNERTRAEGRRAIEKRKEECLEGWAKATGNWHESVGDFTSHTEKFAKGTDSDVYLSDDGTHVIKVSRGKFEKKKHPSDVDQVNLFNFVFPNSAYRILGYGNQEGHFVRYLEQPFVDFGTSEPLSTGERVQYMHELGFEPRNDENTVFSNGKIVVSDLQKNNIIKDASGNISVIDADVKLHTPDIGGQYKYPPVEEDTAKKFSFDENGALPGNSAQEKTKHSLRSDTPIRIVEGDKEHGFKSYKEAKEWAKSHIARTYTTEETGGKGEVRISNTAIDKFLSESAVEKSDDKDVHMSVLRVLPDVLRESVDAEQHPDYKKGTDGRRSIENGVNPDVTIHRCYGAVNIDGKPYRVKITLKENVKTREATKAYSYEATKIELLAGQHGDVTMTSPRNSNNSITAAKLLQGVEKSYEKGKYLLDDIENSASQSEGVLSPGSPTNKKFSVRGAHTTQYGSRDRAIVRDEYERIMRSGTYQFQEAVQDCMLSLKKLMQLIVGKDTNIEDVEGYENAYLAENRMSSVNVAEQHDYAVRYMRPLLDAVYNIAGKDDAARSELVDYMMAKHGLERNTVFAIRDHKLPGSRDYAGLTALTEKADVADAEAEARQMVVDYEAAHPEVNELWDAVNNATKATLRKLYDSGILSKESYDNIAKMFKYYIPLQGFDQKTSDKVYGYLTSKNGLLTGCPIKHAKGRRSKAASALPDTHRSSLDGLVGKAPFHFARLCLRIQ